MWHAHAHAQAYMRLASLAFLVLSLVSLAAFLRILYILPSRTRARAARKAGSEQGQKQREAQTRKKEAKCKVAIFLGSGELHMRAATSQAQRLHVQLIFVPHTSIPSTLRLS